MNNELLCVLAQKGDTAAKNKLIENNLSFVHKLAHEVWSAQNELNQSLGIEADDLVQEGSIGLLRCINSYDPSSGVQFLSYAAPAIRNAMLDTIRRQYATFEGRYLNETVSLDESGWDDNRTRRDFIPDSSVSNPEQLYLAKETHDELHGALRRIERRERAHLWYRYGFEDDTEHPLTETARHFHLSESRAKSTEKAALAHMTKELSWHPWS